MLQQKIIKLKEILKGYQSAAVALSGGVDSTLMLFYAKKVLGAENVKAITLISPVFSEDDIKRGEEFCKRIGVEHIKIETDALFKDEIKKNDEFRCYNCKKYNFGLIEKTANQNHLQVILSGDNLSDDPEKRPGMKALSELGVKSPLRDAGLLKSDIKLLAQLNSICSWCFASNSCYLTRFPEGTEPTLNRINRVKDAENFIKKFIPYERLRVRENDEGDTALIETTDFMMNVLVKNKKTISKALELLGYKKIYIDYNPS